MASFDEIKEKAAAAIDRARPVVEGAVNAGMEKAAELTEKADEWANSGHPEVEKAYEAAGGAAQGAIDAVADGANAAYEFIKNKAEELSGKDVDGDGLIGTKAIEDAVAEEPVVADEAAEEAAEEAADAE